jgi:transcriptional regulator with XRE-family HTH domain
MYKEDRKEEIERIKIKNRRRISENIKYFRKSLEMTQDAFAKAIGSSKSYLSRIENGSRSAGGDVLARIQDHFNKPPEYFYSDRMRKIDVEGKIKILATDKEVTQDLRAGMILMLSKKDMINKGLFIITNPDFEGVRDFIQYKKSMKVEIDPNARKRATAQIKCGFKKF